MKKDAYYFPHFSNARNDSKLIKLRRVMGIEGYGMYFLLLEVLREQTDFKFPLLGLEDLAYDWHTSKEKLLTIVTGFELFEVINDMFFSTKLVFYLQPYLEKSERARVAARIRWDKVKEMQMHTNIDANALPTQCISNASKVKESKVKENKEEEEVYVFNFKKSLLDLNIDRQIVEDWLKVRKTKKATNTETSFNSIRKQISITNKTANECIKNAVENSWAGFKADWLKNSVLLDLQKPKLKAL